MAAARKKWYRQVHRADTNQGPIVDYLRRFGVRVKVVNQVDDFVDLVCSCQGHNFLIEVKHEDVPLKPNQKKFHKNWDGEIYRVETGHEALRKIMAYVAAHDPRVRALIDKLDTTLRQGGPALIERVGMQVGTGRIDPSSW